jgi:flagellar M-ring protein FliF
MNLQELIRRIRNGIVALWQRTERRDRLRFFTVAGVALAIIIVAAVLLNQTNWVPLAGDLTSAQSREITAGLSAQGIPYQEQSGGALVLVPEKRRTEAAAYLIANDIPSDGTSYEIFQRGSGLTVSQYEREKWYYYQLENQLKTELQNVNNIRSATVKLAIPEQRASIFTSSSVPKASVHLVTADGANPDQATVRMAKAMVAGAVVDLAPENVTVTCQNGYVLDDTETMFSRAVDRITQQRMIENELERGVSALLDSIAGPDNYTLGAGVTLNYDRHSEQRLTRVPVVDEDGIIESIQTTSEIARGAGVAAGEPGFDENGGGDDYDEVNQNNIDYWEKNVSIINYLVSEIVEQFEYAEGVVEDIFFSLVLNSNIFTGDNATRTMFQQIVGGAIGLPASKYSNITVNFSAFNGVTQAADDYEAWLAAERRKEAFELIRLIVLYLVIGACIMLLILRTFKILRKEVPPAPEVTPEDAELKELAALAGLAMGAQEVEIGEPAKSPAREQIEKFIEKNPDAVANLLRNWLSDEAQVTKKK